MAIAHSLLSGTGQTLEQVLLNVCAVHLPFKVRVY